MLLSNDVSYWEQSKASVVGIYGKKLPKKRMAHTQIIAKKINHLK
jgi:hypothetical protein